MTRETPWRRLWAEIDAALIRHDERLAKLTGAFLKDIRQAVTEYGRAVDPGSFDEYGLYRMEEVDLPGAEDEVLLEDVDVDQIEEEV